MDISKSRSSIIKAITSPLGFFALSLLTVEGFLGIVLIYSGMDPNQKFIGMIIGAALFIIVVVIVLLLVWHKPKNLTFGEESHLIEEGKYPYGEKENPVSKSELEVEQKTEAGIITKRREKK